MGYYENSNREQATASSSTQQLSDRLWFDGLGVFFKGDDGHGYLPLDRLEQLPLALTGSEHHRLVVALVETTDQPVILYGLDGCGSLEDQAIAQFSKTGLQAVRLVEKAQRLVNQGKALSLDLAVDVLLAKQHGHSVTVVLLHPGCVGKNAHKQRGHRLPKRACRPIAEPAPLRHAQRDERYNAGDRVMPLNAQRHREQSPKQS